VTSGYVNKLYLNSSSSYVNQRSHFGWLQLLLYNLRISWKRYSSHNADRIPLLRAQIKQIEGD